MTAADGFILEKHRTETEAFEAYVNQLEAMVARQASSLEAVERRNEYLENEMESLVARLNAAIRASASL